MKRLMCFLLSLCLVCGALFSCDSTGGKDSAEKYTITFESNGGSAVNAIRVRAGDDITPPASPIREGYVFAGWYEDEELTDKFVFDEMPDEDITLYAKWTKAGDPSVDDGQDGDNTNDGGNTDGGNTDVGDGGNQGGGGQGSGNTNDGNQGDGGNQGGGNQGGGEGPGDRGPDGSWEAVTFGGQTVKVAISINKYDECTFPAADIYTRGPDQAGSNEVAKAVLARNRRAAEDLDITVEYVAKDLNYSEVQADIRSITMTSAINSPDIYNNDMYGLSRAMVDGLLWNVKNPGEDIKNYFDFSADGWYTEFMRGCTFDQEKMYLFAGDYFIDMIRMAWVVYVNNDLLEQNLNKMPEWCNSVDTFYDYVDAGFWDMDLLTDISYRVFRDGAGGMAGVTERIDDLVGFAMNGRTAWVMSAASGVTLYYQDEDNGYKPKVMSDIGDFQKVANKYTDMTNAEGVYLDYEPLAPLNCFFQGNFLFAISQLGEMESYALRDFPAAKGLVPVPKWNADEQEEYRTVIHDQAEIGCILNTAHAFSAASALMQYLNEESDQVIYTYYEKGLKYKYNDDANAREMMDLVRDTTVSPFGATIGRLCENLYTGTGVLRGMWISENSTLGSTFASEKDAYNDCMKKMIAKFKNFD